MELPSDLDLIEPFEPEDLDAAHNLAELLHRKGFDAWVLPDEDDRLGVYVEAEAAKRAKEQARYIRAQHGSDLASGVVSDQKPTFSDRALTALFLYGFPSLILFAGVQVLLTPRHLRGTGDHPIVAALMLVVGIGWLAGALYIHRNTQQRL